VNGGKAMKNMTLQIQRKLYKQYKKARLSDAHNLIHLLRTGSYSKSSDEDILNDAKDDILKFVSHFEDSIIAEAESDLAVLEKTL
jgi:hypothetical protein